MQALVDFLNGKPVTTLIQVAAFAIIAIVGGIVTIVRPDTLNFHEYVVVVTGLAVGNGLLGIGRGISQKGISEQVAADKHAKATVKAAEITSGKPTGRARSGS